MAISLRRTALVTGTSTGIGAAIVGRLAATGWTVFAGVRTDSDGDALAGRIRGDVRPLLLDVADADQIAAAVEQVREAVGAAGLQGLVNNAGIGIGGPVELLPLDDWRRQFEVNVFGTVALTQAAFPLVRSGSGRFVFIGSDSGRVSAPGTAPYSASKHALEAVCESLRHELAGTTMRVALIEPGMVRTPIWDKTTQEIERIDALLPPERREDYGWLIPATRGFVKEGSSKGVHPDKVAAKVEHALTAPRPRARYLVGPDAKLLALLTHVPDPVRDRALAALTQRLVRLGNKGVEP